MTTKVVLHINDLHCGSEEGIMPEIANSNLEDEARSNRVEANPIQAWMLKHWYDMCDMEKYDVVIADGDLVEGPNRKESGIGNWTNNLKTQSITAADLISMTEARKYYVTQGSPYHTGLNGSSDQDTAIELGAVFDEDLFLKIDKVRIYARHVTGYSDIPHGRSTALNRDMMNAELQKKMYGGSIDVHLRGHTHYTHEVTWEGKKGIIGPCWKYRDGFVRRRGMNGNDLGFTVLYIDGETVTTQVYTWKMPGKVAITEHVYEG